MSGRLSPSFFLRIGKGWTLKPLQHLPCGHRKELCPSFASFGKTEGPESELQSKAIYDINPLLGFKICSRMVCLYFRLLPYTTQQIPTEPQVRVLFRWLPCFVRSLQRESQRGICKGTKYSETLTSTVPTARWIIFGRPIIQLHPIPS